MEAPEHLQVLSKPLLLGSGGGGDHFLVEDLLDFSNDDEGEEIAFGSAADESSSAAAPQLDRSSTSPASATDSHFLGDSALSEELCVPYDELAELEWLSHFVEDSFSSDSSSHPKLQHIPSSTTITTTHSSTATVANCITTPPSPPLFSPDPPVRSARSKRSRAPPRDWASRLLVLTPSSIPPEASLLSPPLHPPPPSTPPPKKPAKASSVKKQGHPLEPSLAPNPDGRKCLHCATDKTPQWRTGPMGPKTLCNACGVRYKSGRLVPEYRPAASPTFMLSKHSNSHRKVMELRRQKEIQHQQQPQSGGGLGVGGGVFAGHYQQQGAGGFYDGGDDFLIHNHLVPDFRQLI